MKIKHQSAWQYIVSFLLVTCGVTGHAWGQTVTQSKASLYETIDAITKTVDRQEVATFIRTTEASLRAVIAPHGLFLGKKSLERYRQATAELHKKTKAEDKIAYITAFTKEASDDLNMAGDYSEPMRVLVYPDPILQSPELARTIGKSLDDFHLFPQSTWTTEPTEIDNFHLLCRQATDTSVKVFCANFYGIETATDDDPFFPDTGYFPYIVTWSSAPTTDLNYHLGSWLQFHSMVHDHSLAFSNAYHQQAHKITIGDHPPLMDALMHLELHLEQLHLEEHPTDEELAAALQSISSIARTVVDLCPLIFGTNKNDNELKGLLKKAYDKVENQAVKTFVEALIDQIAWRQLATTVRRVSNETTVYIVQNQSRNYFAQRYGNPPEMLRKIAAQVGLDPLQGRPIK